MLCINLRERYGHRYAIGVDESGRASDPWYLRLEGRSGHIYPVGPHELGAATNGPRVVAKLAAIPGVEISQDGDDGANALFAEELLSKVARVLRLRSARSRGGAR